VQIEKDIDYTAIFNEYCRPLKPLATKLKESLGILENIRALIFDIYGTLFISDSGDIGTARNSGNKNIFTSALEKAGVNITSENRKKAGIHLLHDAIKHEHVRLKNKGIDYPEIDIIEIWKSVLNEIDDNHTHAGEYDDSFIKKLALSFELQVNPVWPMPGILDVLSWFTNKKYFLGVVSNAQFYTPLIFKGLLRCSLSALGFNEDLLIFSYKHSMAKPSLRFFELLLERLQNTYSVLPEQIIYIGNDMLNDIYPALQLGMRTALFAGDARSLRLRKDNPLCKDIKPDIVITNLKQLIEVIR